MRMATCQIQKTETISPPTTPRAAPMATRVPADVLIEYGGYTAGGRSVPREFVLGVLGRLLDLSGGVLHVFACVLCRRRGLVVLAFALELGRARGATKRFFALSSQFLHLVRERR